MHNIEPKTQVPPPDWLRQVRGKDEPQTMPYQHDVYRIRDEVIPEAFSREFTFDWLGFVAACLFTSRHVGKDWRTSPPSAPALIPTGIVRPDCRLPHRRG